jgi:hypothetical protein
VEQVRAMSAKAFFTRLATLMVDNPPTPADAPMMRRLAALETTLPGLARRDVPYVFAPPTERLPAALSDLNNLVPHDPALQALLSSPAAVVVEHHERAVGLLLRGALVDVARRHGLPLRSAGEDGGSVLRVTVDAEDVPDRSGILGGMLRSYTTHVVVALERPGAAPVDSGVVMQLLGINESRALDGNIDRFVDRALTGFVVELIRRSLQGTLAG